MRQSHLKPTDHARIRRSRAKSGLNRADRSPKPTLANPNLGTLRNRREGGKLVPIESSRRATSRSGAGWGSRGGALQGSGSDREFVRCGGRGNFGERFVRSTTASFFRADLFIKTGKEKRQRNRDSQPCRPRVVALWATIPFTHKQSAGYGPWTGIE